MLLGRGVDAEGTKVRGIASRRANSAKEISATQNPLRDAIREVSPSVFQIAVVLQVASPEFRGSNQGIGTAFFVNHDGYALTAAHVLAGLDATTIPYKGTELGVTSRQLMARFGNPANDQAEAKFTIVEKDTVNDIALIHTLPMSSIRVPKLSVGDPEEAERICETQRQP